MPWDENNVNKLKELWDQGLPTAQIGKLLGFTKNAVVGKAHRIGLERRPSPIRRTAVKPDRKKARSPIMPVLNFENNTSSETTNINKTFQPIMGNPFKSPNKNGCEWPIGHPDEQNFHFCDKKKFNDKPYCLEHCAVAYVLPEKEEELNVINQLV
ncbi:MAG: hypothetical protein CFH19_00050 [Alphaproteobacteria bacterium MarineAlpha5_Bin9]|nr:MAG: hypothetical protein CFH19_00050 [Alphaproteobacteria bacterium MarineAlpha5_Bin9]|tara:strand:+ start:6789 stop:7253 length:465 start_codon:yes stop_codon:yes gene_type:complete